MSKIYVPSNRKEIHYLRKYQPDAFIFLTILYDSAFEEKNLESSVISLYSVYEFEEDLCYESTRKDIPSIREEKIEESIENFYRIVHVLEDHKFIKIIEDSAYCDIKVQLFDWISVGNDEVNDE